MKIYQLPKDLTVKKLYQKYKRPIFIMPFFIPSLGIDKKAKEKSIAIFANRMARKRQGNAIRFFSAGVWEQHTVRKVHFPYFRKKNEKFDLDRYNSTHLEALKRRVEIFVERNITVVLTLIDNSSLHNRPNGWWGEHWMNGNNNVNKTSSWNGSVYHYYENPDDEKQVKTRRYCEAYYRYLLEELEETFKPYIIWEFGNEVQAGFGWNIIMNDIVDEFGPGGRKMPKWRKMYSLFVYEWYASKQIWEVASPCIHGINNPLTYESSKQYFRPGVRYLPSEDGAKPEFPQNVYMDRIYQILSDGNLGYERNERPFWYQPNWKDWWRIMRWHGAKKMSEGWQKWLEEN